jgi:hypothetical protein
MKNNELILKLLTELQYKKGGVYRKFMTSEEIKICNYLVKLNFLYKSYPSEQNATIAYFISNNGIKHLEKFDL